MKIWWWFVWSIPLLVSIAFLQAAFFPGYEDHLVYGIPLLVVTIAAAVKKVEVGYIIENKVLRVLGNIGAFILVVLFISFVVHYYQAAESKRQDREKARQKMVSSFGQGFFE